MLDKENKRFGLRLLKNFHFKALVFTFYRRDDFVGTIVKTLVRVFSLSLYNFDVSFSLHDREEFFTFVDASRRNKSISNFVSFAKHAVRFHLAFGDFAHLGCTWGVLGVYMGCTWGVPVVYQECTWGVHGM